MAANPNTLASNFSADVSTYIAAKLLILAKKDLVLYGICDHRQLPKNEGRTMQYSRYERVALPQSPLSEGVTPDGSSMSVSTVTAVLDQWGGYITLTDVAIDSVKHPVLQQAIQKSSMQAAETLDREVSKVLLTGTNIFFANGKASRALLTTGDELDGADLSQVTATLRANGARPKAGPMYLGAVHPYSEEDITNDAAFIEVARYRNDMRVFEQEIGTWKGVRWVRSNFLPFVHLVAGVGSAGANDGSGSLAASTAYDFSVSIIDALTGFETHVSANVDQSTGVGEDSVDITLPALPATATPGSTFNVYAGLDGGTRYLYSSGHAAAAVVRVLSIPTSGDVAQAVPPGGGKTVYHAFIFGMEGVICTEFNKVRALMTPGVPSDSDPLLQRRKVGWKADFKVVIANDDFLARIEHVTTSGDL